MNGRLTYLAWVLTVILAADARGIIIGNSPMQYDEAERALDKVPPSPPTLELRRIRRGIGPVQVDSLVSINSDGDTGSIYFLVSKAADDRTPSQRIGYRLHFVDGKLPRRLEIPADAFLGHPTLHWVDGGTWEQEAFAFRVQATAVDRAGNESSPSNIIIVGHDGDTTWLKRETEIHEERMRIYARRLGYGEDARAVSNELFVELSPSPGEIGEIFSASTHDLMRSIHAGRVERAVVLDNHEEASGRSFDRGLTNSEVHQLKTMLLNNKTYMAEATLCEFIPGYTFSLQSDSSEVLVLVSRSCNLIQVHPPNGSVQRVGIAPEWTPILRGFCDGVLSLPALADGHQ